MRCRFRDKVELMEGDRVVMGGGAEFPDVDPRFALEAKRIFGPFWSLTVTDTLTGRVLKPISGGGLTGWGSVRRQAKYGTQRYLRETPQQQRRWDRSVKGP
jgi:hypothetical protein